MEELWARIQQQNEEMDRENAERAAASNAQSRIAQHEAYVVDQQQQQQQQQQYFNNSVPVRLSEAALREQEQSARRGSNPGRPGGGRLQHAQGAAQKENQNRGKIPLLPARGGAPPSTSGGQSVRPPPSEAASARPPPSVAGSMAPSLRQPRGVHYTHGMNGRAAPRGQMDHFLDPVDGIRGEMRRAGVEPRDHVRENRALLSEMAQVKRQQRDAEADAAESKTRRDAGLRERARQRAQQTLAAGMAELDVSDGPGYYDGAAPPSRGASAGRRSVRPPPTGQEPPPASARPHDAGHVPAYLKRRKAEWAAEAAEVEAREARAAECPPGTRLVGPEEKALILEKLADERAKATLELRQLPFVVKTQATQQKKDRLEARLEEIAGAEEAYAREKVFVPADM